MAKSTEKFSSQVVKMAKEHRKAFKSSRKNGKDYSKVVKMAQSTAKQVTLGMAGLAITAKF